MEQLYKYGTIDRWLNSDGADFSTIEAVSLDPLHLPLRICRNFHPVFRMLSIDRDAGMIFSVNKLAHIMSHQSAVYSECKVLRAALAQVFARHPVLRTV
jgi:hypothetical protein